MQAEKGALRRIKDTNESYVLRVPLKDTIDGALDPAYLKLFVYRDTLALDPGDVILVRSIDFAWEFELTIIAASKKAHAVVTRLTKPPFFYLLKADERNALFMADVIDDVAKGGMSPDLDARMAVLTNLRNQAEYPSEWIAQHLTALERALDKGFL